MLAAGITVELHVYPGAPHGFEMIVPRRRGVAVACQRDIDEALRRALERDAGSDRLTRRLLVAQAAGGGEHGAE